MVDGLQREGSPLKNLSLSFYVTVNTIMSAFGTDERQFIPKIFVLLYLKDDLSVGSVSWNIEVQFTLFKLILT